MNKINSYVELSKLIFLYLKKDMITNTFLSKEEFENEIDLGNLYYISFNQGLFILRDRGDFYILNYYLIDIKLEEIRETFTTELNKPVVVEIVGKNEGDVNYLKAVKIFENLGMNIEIKRERFTKKTNECMKLLSSEDVNKDVSNVKKLIPNIEPCEIQDLNTIKNMLFLNFDKYYGCIPLNENLKRDIISKNIYKATIDNKMVGILHFSKTSKSSEIKHLCVDSEYRNIGIAKSLLKQYDKDIDVNKTVWTGKENVSAQKVYADSGYTKDGFVSTVLKVVYKK